MAFWCKLFKNQTLESVPERAGDFTGGRIAGMNINPDLTSTAYARQPEDVLAALGVSLDAGLSQADAAARLQDHGPNLLTRRRQAVAFDILVHQFASPVVVLLAIAAAVSLAYGEFVEALAIGMVLIVNATIGFVAEIRAVRTMEALRQLGTVTTRVRREGRTIEVPAQELVPGDIVILEGALR